MADKKSVDNGLMDEQAKGEWSIRMELQESLLRFACFKLARNRLWQMRLIDAEEVEHLADSFYEIAINHVELIGSKSRDPNLLVRAVRFLEQIDGNSPTEDDAQWFQQSLSMLIELACPSVHHTDESSEFLDDLEDGITEARLELID